jgi:hypothetical protein
VNGQFAWQLSSEGKLPDVPGATWHLKSFGGVKRQLYVVAGAGVGVLAHVKNPVAMLHLQLLGSGGSAFGAEVLVWQFGWAFDFGSQSPALQTMQPLSFSVKPPLQ